MSADFSVRARCAVACLVFFLGGAWPLLAQEIAEVPPAPPIDEDAPAGALEGEWLADCLDCDDSCNYGPPGCEPRGTLLQWSYGTSFSGGPDLDEPLITDRPDFTESPVTVGRGVWQFEFGYTYTDADQTFSHSYPELLIRRGIFAEWLELRIGWSYLEEEMGGTRNTGSVDLNLGLKLALTPQEGILPETGLIVQVFVPTGAAAFTSGDVQPGLNYLYGWEVNDWFSVAGSTQGLRANDDSGEDYLLIAQSFTTAYSLTDCLGGYIEWYAFFPHSAVVAQTEHYINGGLTYLITDNFQFDVRIGGGLNDAADDIFFGSGFSWRL